MKLEAFKAYRTRSGLQVILAAVGPFHATGNFRTNDKPSILKTASWNLDGTTAWDTAFDLIDYWSGSEKEQMKLEVGKFYRTKIGFKVRIYAIDGNNEYEYPVHGAFFSKGWISSIWNLWGKSSTMGAEYNIVAEWEDECREEHELAWITPQGDVKFTYKDEFVHSKQDWTRAPWLDKPKTFADMNSGCKEYSGVGGS